MLIKLNRFLRYAVLVTGGIYGILKFIENIKKQSPEKTEVHLPKEGFQTKEFDDIW